MDRKETKSNRERLLKYILEKDVDVQEIIKKIRQTLDEPVR